MTSPSISVLTPARNEQEKILRSVRSVLRQLREDDELIVYDDCSTDQTLEILQSVNDRRLRLIEGQTQVGAAMAENILVEEANFDVVARLDADDYALPGRFEYQRGILAKGEHDMVFGLAIQKRGFLVVPQIPKTLSSTRISTLLPFVNPLVNSTLMTNKSIVTELGACSEGFQAEDYSLFLRAAIAGKKLLRSNKYLVIREVPLKKEPKEVRQRPWNPDLDIYRVKLLTILQAKDLFDHKERLEDMSHDQVLSLINSTERQPNALRRAVNRVLG